MKHHLFWHILLGGLALAVVLYVLLVVLVYYWEVTVPEPKDYDGIIVLGCQVKPDGEPSVQLAWRLDTALKYYQASPCTIVVTGAQGKDEPAPEAVVMRDYLAAAGVPKQVILTDSQSFDTKENIRNAWALLSPLGCEKPIIITSDYHVHRALAIAADAGITAQGAGAPCRSELPFWLKNHCREALAWVKYWAVKYLKLPL